MSIVLGINTAHAGSSAALIIDGAVVVAVAEERLNRVKYYAGFPELSIQYCLDHAGIKLEDIDGVAVGRDAAANLGKKLSYLILHPTKLLTFLRLKASKKEMDDLKSQFAKTFGIDQSKLKFQQYNVEHHLAHISSAYFLSGWEHSAGISIDGSGDFVSCMMAECSGRSIEVKHRIFVPHSLGLLYTMVCQFIGYDRYGDEGKVMGLAPLGENRYKEIFDDMLIMNKAGIKLNYKYFRPFGSSTGYTIDEKGQTVIARHYSDEMIRLFGPPRIRNSEITKRDMDMAFGLQAIFEKGYLHLLKVLETMVKSEKVSMAGGCALNSVANGKIFSETNYTETFIQPAAGDEGLALGAALYVSQSILKEKKTPKMIHSYLGTEYSDERIEAALKKTNLKYTRLDHESLLAETTDELVKGNVVGWFQGRMEWGPRALGCRSILAHPGLHTMKDTLNARIKHREEFRPFAPVVLEEHQNEVFEHDYPSPFMLHVYKIRPEWRKRLPAVNHVDDTGRLQSLNREENPLFYDLIGEFYKKTGIPVILNTSFNENEPVVSKPEEAIDCFLRTKMDTLVIGSFFCRKNEI
jgi:carbamoyltransferase